MTGTLVPAEAFDGVVGELDPITVDLVISVTNGVKVVRGTSDGIELSFDDEPQVGLRSLHYRTLVTKMNWGFFLSAWSDWSCRGCLRTYWEPSHYRRSTLREIVGDVATGTELTITGVAKSGDYLRLTGGLQ